MRYVGGKVRQAKLVRDTIVALRGTRTEYLEPFIGGGSVFALVAPLFQKAVGADIVPDLIKFWESVRNGWMPPETLTKQRYMELLEEGPSALRAWAGFAASYNGRWWGGYGPKASGRDYLAESVRSTRKKAVGMRATGVSFRCSSFEYHDADSNTVVYCDIPYQKDSGNNHSGLRVPYGVTGHKIYGSGDFDYALFWQTAEAWVAHGALVLVHEYTVPDGWVPVAQTTRVETMNHRRESSGGRKETLWMHPASLVEK